MAGRSEQWLKQIGRFWLRAAAPRPGPPPAPRDLDDVADILVIRLDDRLGNIVLLTALLVALKGRFSRARLSCCLARRYWDLREFIPSVDEFIPFDRAAMARNPLRIRPLLRRLRAQRYDLVFDASDDRSVSFNHLAVTALSGGRFRIGHDRGEASRFYELAVPVPGDSRHAAEMHLDLLRGLTSIKSHPRPLLKPPRNDTGYARKFRAQFGITPEAPLVVVHPGGRGPKRWPATEFAAVIRSLQDAGHVRIALVWGPADADAARAVMRASGDIVHPAGILPFDDLVSLVSDASVFLSGDCGPMHLASALGTPTVAVFLVSDADKYRPLGDYDTVFDGRTTEIGIEDVAHAVDRTARENRNMAARRVRFRQTHVENTPGGETR